MYLPRVIPVLCVRNGRLVKTARFRGGRYLGDPINAVRIFNEKCADELVLLDIGATVQKRPPDVRFIREIASEAFVPLTYGGGVTNVEQMSELYRSGIEKIAVNSHALEDPDFVRRAAERFGSSSVVVSIDVRRDWRGRPRVVSRNGRRFHRLGPVEHASKMVEMGAGEVFITAVDRDGTMGGYDIDLVRSVAEEVAVPVIACGGAGGLEDLEQVVKIGKASAAAAGSLFVFYGPHRAVLITFPEERELVRLFGNGNSIPVPDGETRERRI